MPIDSGKDTSSAVPINPNWTRAYQEALLQDKGVMYICRQGLGRSQTAYEQAISRGEARTFFLDGGIWSLYDPYALDTTNQKTEEQARNELLELARNNYLRIIEDDFDHQTPDYLWLHRQLASLKEQGIEEHKNYEYITTLQTSQEDQETLLKQLNIENMRIAR